MTPETLFDPLKLAASRLVLEASRLLDAGAIDAATYGEAQRAYETLRGVLSPSGPPQPLPPNVIPFPRRS
jgi:hypothetical protein